MPGLRIDELKLPAGRGRRLSFRVWREWCFVRTAARHLRWRVLLILTVLLGGGLLFQRFAPDRKLSLIEATYDTWSLVFAQPPDGGLPGAPVLRVMYFLVPVLGLTVIIESIVDLSLMLRDRRRYERSWSRMMASSMSNHIVLVGLGKLGYRTFSLLRRLGEPVVVLECDPENQFLEDVRRDGSPLILGDARREALLDEANVAQARSIILATDDDLANLEVALDARRVQPKIRVVLRMFDQNMADKIRAGFNIHIAMSQSAMSAPAFATAAIDASVINGFVVGQQLVVMQRWIVREGGPLAGRTIAEVTTEMGAGVVEHRTARGDARLFPLPHTPLQQGDELLVQGPFETLANLRKKSPALFA